MKDVPQLLTGLTFIICTEGQLQRRDSCKGGMCLGLVCDRFCLHNAILSLKPTSLLAAHTFQDAGLAGRFPAKVTSVEMRQLLFNYRVITPLSLGFFFTNSQLWVRTRGSLSVAWRLFVVFVRVSRKAPVTGWVTLQAHTAAVHTKEPPLSLRHLSHLPVGSALTLLYPERTFCLGPFRCLHSFPSFPWWVPTICFCVRISGTLHGSFRVWLRWCWFIWDEIRFNLGVLGESLGFMNSLGCGWLWSLKLRNGGKGWQWSMYDVQIKYF